MKILSVLHDSMAPTATLGECIVCRGGSYEEVTPHDGDSLPADHRDYDGVIVMGGPMDADDDANYPHFRPLIQMLQGFHAAGKPMLGVCLGAQIFARVFGKAVKRHHELEFGFTENFITDDGARDPLLAGLARSQWLMQWHQDTFDLPDGAVLLMTGAACANQGIRLGDSVYAFQFHLETTKPILRTWVRVRHDFLAREHPYFFDKIEQQFAAHMDDQLAFTRTVGDRWIDLVEKRMGRG
jgi:GMP synthase-like glutamine amidotransferase